MNHNASPFRKENLRSIRRMFEEKTGVSLEGRSLFGIPQGGKPRRPALRRTATALAVLLAFFAPVSALAAGVPVVYDLLYAVSPAAAQLLRPVRLSCEDNGIRMEVLSAYIHADTAEICVSMQDLTGDRIDKTIDLYDYDIYTMHAPSGRSITCARAGYDEATRTATFLIHITQWDSEPITGEKITFSVESFLSGKHTFEGALPEADVSKASLAPETRQIDGLNGLGGMRYADFDDTAPITVLAPSGEPYSPVDGVTITALGYIDGMLRVQILYDNIGETDNHGFVYLQNDAGETIQSVLGISYRDDAYRDSYNEKFFDVTPEILEGYTLYGWFVTCDTMIRGNWAVTFPLNTEQE